MILCYISVSLIPIGDAITVIYGEPLCTMILSYIFLGTRLRLFKMFAASFLIAGILLVVRPPFIFPEPDALHAPSHGAQYFWGVAAACGVVLLGNLKLRNFVSWQH